MNRFLEAPPITLQIEVARNVISEFRVMAVPAVGEIICLPEQNGEPRLLKVIRRDWIVDNVIATIANGKHPTLRCMLRCTLCEPRAMKP